MTFPDSQFSTAGSSGIVAHPPLLEPPEGFARVENV
jgi:hypothetical protein